MHFTNIVFLTWVLGMLLSASVTYAQGCVAIRGGSACGGSFGRTLNLGQGEFNLQGGFRHFKSFRHFRGAEEEHNRLDDGTEVINQSSFLDLGLTYGITDRWFATAILPVVFHTRSSMYAHGGNPPNGLGERHVTSSRGLSDIAWA